MGAISKPDDFVSAKRNHNIPHYTNLERVKEVGYKTNPFTEDQTVFHMPPTKTQKERIKEFIESEEKNTGKKLSFDDVIPFYDLSNKPIFDGLSKEESFKRLADSEKGNIKGTFFAKEADKDKHAIPTKTDIQVKVDLKKFSPVRLSIADGGGEQVELRVENEEIDQYAKFTEL